MTKCICHICGDLYMPYDSPNYGAPVADNIRVCVYDLKTEHLNTRQWYVCRHCATAVRAHIDQLSRKYRKEFK